jgi:hypothetical protein
MVSSQDFACRTRRREEGRDLGYPVLVRTSFSVLAINSALPSHPGLEMPSTVVGVTLLRQRNGIWFDQSLYFTFCRSLYIRYHARFVTISLQIIGQGSSICSRWIWFPGTSPPPITLHLLFDHLPQRTLERALASYEPIQAGNNRQAQEHGAGVVHVLGSNGDRRGEEREDGDEGAEEGTIQIHRQAEAAQGPRPEGDGLVDETLTDQENDGDGVGDDDGGRANADDSAEGRTRPDIDETEE